MRFTPDAHRSLVPGRTCSEIVEIGRRNCARYDDPAEVSDALLRTRQAIRLFRSAVGHDLEHAGDGQFAQDRKRRGIVATFKSVDTCAAEFEAYTPYYYSTYEDEDETPRKPPGGKRIMILGGGPNRIGQGIEFDYCCCHASFALRELGIESVMVNSQSRNGQHRLRHQRPAVLRAADDGRRAEYLRSRAARRRDRAIRRADAAEPGAALWHRRRADHRHQRRHDRRRRRPRKISAAVAAARLAAARQRHRPHDGRKLAPKPRRSAIRIWCGPSFVLGGRAMEICYDQTQLERFVAEAFIVAQGQPVLIDRFLEDAIEVDVDAICDGQQVIVAGIMEHIEEAGVHSGDSACAIPPYSLHGPMLAGNSRSHASAGAQVASRRADEHSIRDQKEDGRQVLYVLEVNPRASRTVPFVAKATGMPVAKSRRQSHGGRFAGGAGLSLRSDSQPCFGEGERVSVPKFPGVDIVLGPEMRSTGEVMGSERAVLDRVCQEPAGGRHSCCRATGTIFISVASPAARSTWPDWPPQLVALGYQLACHRGHRAATGGGRNPSRARQETAGRAPEFAGLSDRRPDAADHEHAQRQGRPHRRGPHPRSGGGQWRALHHHHSGRRRWREGDGSAARRRFYRASSARPLCETRAGTAYVGQKGADGLMQFWAVRGVNRVCPIRVAARRCNGASSQ